MKKYIKNYIGTFFIICTIVTYYILRQFNIPTIFHIMINSVIIGLNLVIIFSTVPSFRKVREFSKINPNREKKETLLKYHREALKILAVDMGNLKKIIIVVVTIGSMLIMGYMNQQGMYSATVINRVLDFISAIALGAAFLQSHMSYTIMKSLEKNK